MSVAKINFDELNNEALIEEEAESPFSIYWKRLKKHRLAFISALMLLLIILSAAFGPLIMSNMTYYNVQKGENIYYSRDAQDLQSKKVSPSAEHWLGTDELGRDVLFRLLIAGRLSLTISLTVVFIQVSIGLFLGAVSGYYGGWVDSLIQRVVEFIIILPTLPLLLVLSSLLRDWNVPGIPPEWSQSIFIIIILSLLGWPGSCRLSRGVVLSLRRQEFTEAAKALGMSDLGIIMRHMIPNALPPIIVSATLGLGGVILVESALSFLGFGINPPVATWGNMLQNAQTDMLTAPWKALIPGFFILISVLSFNYLGDGLRDALDPRLKL